jgi:outer membrane receptor for ferrienterochelin and colicin
MLRTGTNNFLFSWYKKLSSVKFPFALLLALLIQITSGAQTANITGKITNNVDQENVEAATIVVKGTQLATVSDKFGNYELRNVPAGKHTIEVSNISYDTRNFMLDVSPGQVIIHDIQLVAKSSELEAVVVTSQRRSTGTQLALVSETRNAKSIISGISRQQITLSQDANAAQVMQRVPGVTIIENRFVMVRGLGERYNNVMINNTVAPSTEVDKRTFSFDLIPSNSLERMIIYKSGSPENPGDFAGGVIKVFTNNLVEKPFTQISIGTGFRTNTTFKEFVQSKGSSTDILGFDNSYRILPLNFPSSKRMIQSSRTAPLRRAAAHLMNNNFQPQSYQAAPDLNLGFSIGRRLRIGNVSLSNVSSFNITQTYQAANRDFFRYFEYDETRPGEVDKRFAYLDNVYEKQNRISAMSNFSLILSPRSRINFSNLFNQIGENETYLRQGEDFIQTLGWRRHYMLAYRNRSIYTGQLDGNHTLSDRWKLNWVGGFGWLLENEPDLRRFRTFAPGGQDAPLSDYIMITPPSSNLFDASRYYGNLQEYSVNNGVDLTFKLNENREGASRELKFGYYADYRYRDFSSRYFSYLIPGSVDPITKEGLERLPLDVIFSNDNIKTRNGFVIEEGTRPQDSYTASNMLGAGYLSFVYPLNKFNFSGGIRAEYNIQEMDSYQGLSPVTVSNPVLSLLPSVNAMYNLSSKSQVRLGYSRTVNRPEFRELAPFLFYDYKLDANRVGNPNLKTAVIDNIDFRYEFYPRLGETVSLGTFFKYFNDPIENKAIITTESPQFTYLNANYAYNYGVEVEVKKSLDQMFGSSFLNKLAVNLNAAYIFSEVDLGEQASAQTRVRALQGQSPYIVNTTLSYNDLQRKLLLAASYNIFGTRLYAVGDLNTPDIYEMPRHSLDFTLTKTFNAFAFKAGVQDILNYTFRFYQDTDRNGKVSDSIDKPIFTFRRGTLFNAGFTLNL